MRTVVSRFPGGFPSVGLLLLRVAVGASLIAQGVSALPRMAALLGVASGLCLLAGYVTPFAAVLAAAAELALPPAARGLFGACGFAGLAAVVAVAIAFAGPGADSLDARLFGRREIRIPGPRGKPRKR